MTAFQEPWDTTTYHRDLPHHWICAQSSSSRQAQVSPDQVRAVSGWHSVQITAKKEVTVCTFFAANNSSWGRRRAPAVQMVRFKNRYFVVEVIWDEAFEVC